MIGDKHFPSNEQEYVDLINKYGDNRICIYGAGNYGGILFDFCKEHTISIDFFCVTDLSNSRSELKGISVIPFQELVAGEQKILVLVGVSGKAGEAIEKRLEANRQFDFIPFPEWLIEYDSLSKRRYESPIIEVTPSIGCCIQCKFCPQSLLMKEYFKHDTTRKAKMEIDEFKEILDKLPPDTIIDFSGFVEPFQNPSAIEMMEYTNMKRFDETLFTTLRGVNKETAYRLIRIPFSMVVLHLADAEGYSNIPVTDEYIEVLNIIVNAKKQDNSPFVRSSNCHGDIHPRVKEVIEGKIIVNGEMMDRAGNLDGEDLIVDKRELTGSIKCCRSRQLNHNVLLPDGTLVLCCNDYGMQHVLGNLRTQTYSEIMNGLEMTSINRKMKGKSDDTLLCRKCIYAIEDKTI